MEETYSPGFYDRVEEQLKENKKLSPECRSFILDCMHPEPKERPTAGALLEHDFIKARNPDAWNNRVSKHLSQK